jgi:bifunctional non-homologous end joining protein LigD
MGALRTDGAAGELVVAGRRLKIGKLDRIIFPRTGTTKAQVLDYYVRVGDAILPHLRGRLLHMHRYPEGVEGPRFWQKACPEHRPDWVPTVPVWSREKQAPIEYCVIEELPALLWAVNLGSLELHTSLHTRDDLHRPTALAFDLDPGEGVEIGLRAHVKTSGSKGLQLFVPLNTPVTYAQTKPLSRAIAETLEAAWPERVVSRMAKALRSGKVLIDWQQNTEHKSMVCVYSLRAKARPTVSTPVRWDELEAAVAGGDPQALVFEMDEVAERVAAFGDLFAEVLTTKQELGQVGSS